MRFPQKRKFQDISIELIEAKKARFSAEFCFSRKRLLKTNLNHSCEFQQSSKYLKHEIDKVFGADDPENWQTDRHTVTDSQVHKTFQANRSTAFDLKFFSNFHLTDSASKSKKDFLTTLSDEVCLIYKVSRLSDNVFVSGAVGLRFNSFAGQIKHSVANDDLQLL